MSGPYGAELAMRKRPASEAFDMGQFGIPYADQGTGNVYTYLKVAPLPGGAHILTRRGHLLFLYRPDKRLTGDDGTDTVYGLPDVNYGLYQRAVYEDMRARGMADSVIPVEVLRHKEWPSTVDEFLSERIIVPVGVRDQEPNDIRLEGQVAQVPAQISGLAENVPWIWGSVRAGDVVGFRLGMIRTTRAALVGPKGEPLNEILGRSVLQLTPMILQSGARYHGIGNDENPTFELDFKESFRVASRERRLDEYGLPLGELFGEPAEMAYETHGSGFFLRLGKVGKMTGTPPSSEVVRRAIRTYSGLTNLLNTHNRLGIWLTPNPLLEPF